MCTASPSSCLQANLCTHDAVRQNREESIRVEKQSLWTGRALNLSEPDIYVLDSITERSHCSTLATLNHTS